MAAAESPQHPITAHVKDANDAQGIVMALALPNRSPDRSLEAPASQVLLIEPRILRRVIRLDRRLAGLGLSVPHATSYVIERARLLAYTELDELGLPPTADLPRHVILIAQLADEGARQSLPRDRQLAHYRRQLFHAKVHLELQQQLVEHESLEALVTRRQREIGAIEFEEIRSVLLKDGLLFSEASDLETYVEFVAVYLELRYFAPSQLAWYFPAIRDWTAIDQLVSRDLNHASILASAQQMSRQVFGDSATDTPAAATGLRRGAPTIWRIRTRHLPARARRAAAQGNGVRAAILWTLSVAQRGMGDGVTPPTAAVRELERVVSRLQPVLRLSNSATQDWTTALQPLLVPAAREIWTVEARLLYDLQKACVEYERGVFKFDLFRWLRTLGRRPLRRPLPLMREVLITKHLRSAMRRLSSAQLDTTDRERLSRLLAEATQEAEQQVRASLRPRVLQVLDEVRVRPTNTAEHVARLNVVEGLLDVIVEQGVANLGHLRDAISRNDIKLPDLAGAAELIQGDPLLLADRRLADQLAGVYRPGAIYLRWAQRLSSIAFGTPTGRFLTRYVALPFGGAFLLLEGVGHLFGFTTGPRLEQAVAAVDPHTVQATGHTRWAAVVALGMFLLMLMHSSRFRHWCRLQTQRLWQLLRGVLVDWPARLVNSPMVQDFLRSPTYAALRSYVLWPGIVVGLVRAVAQGSGRSVSGHVSLELFLATALFLNSRIGRYLDERIGDLLLRAWHELRMRVFAALFEWIMDTFRRVFAYLERIVYTVDEWLRFRAGDNRRLEAVKLLSGACWFFVSYIVILVFTLLIEPQINPIKHFPVVTVSHKLLLPAGPVFVEQLAPLVGVTRARTLVWSTIWLIPGVFGFLVWELKENWRLYEANRPRRLVPTPVGRHGETMVRLLRPGFHSGTIPKLFAAVRSAMQTAEDTGDRKLVERKFAAVRRIEEAVTRFVDRKLITLWKQSARTAPLSATIQRVHLATSRIEVDLRLAGDPQQVIGLTWQEQGNELCAQATADPWVHQLDPAQRAACAVALMGLFQLSAADKIQLEPAFPACTPMDRQTWVDYWSG